MGKVTSIGLVSDDSPIYDQPLIIGGTIYKGGSAFSAVTGLDQPELHKNLESEMERTASRIYRELIGARKSHKKSSSNKEKSRKHS